MAIPFGRLMPIRLTPLSGAVRPLAYTARTALHDPRLDAVFDYTHLDGDYACGDIIVPEGHPAAFKDLEFFAASLDNAEWSKLHMALEDRERGVQVGLSLVVALPPNDQLWLHEAAELLRWIATAPPRSHEVAIHWAIHESILNRHGHVWYALRSFDPAGNAGPKLRDFIVHHRSTAAHTGIVEGVNWPTLSWEVQQTYFTELGIDLAVDPIAPVPGRHLSPLVHVNGTIPRQRTAERVARARERAHGENVKAIRGDPEKLVKTLLRGRSSIRIAELERLCTRFFDHPADRTANAERILVDENIMTLADDDTEKPRYLTTRRIHELVTQATELIDNSSEDRITTITARDSASLVRRIAEHCHARNHPDHPLILGHALSDCREVALALEADAPLVGTVDMAVTGSDEVLGIGRERGLTLHGERLVIVPHSERIDDQRLAHLLKEANTHGARLILGHDQSSMHGVVHHHLASYAADRMRATAERYGRNDVERLLRAGLVRLAVEAMVDCGLVSFAEFPDRGIDDPSLFVSCQDRRRIDELAGTIRKERVRAKTLEPPEQLTTLRGPLDLSVGEWIVTSQTCEHPRLEAGQFTQIVVIDRSNNLIEIMHDGKIKRIDLETFAAIRSATTITIREARGLPANMRLEVELTDRRRTWAALLLVAGRRAHARLHVDPKLTRDAQQLADIARRSLPGALPHQRAMKPDLDAEIGKMLLPKGKDALEPELFRMPPAPVRAPPRPIPFEETLRGAIASDIYAREGYSLLYHHVGPHNRERGPNAERILALCTSDLTAALVRFLANLEPRQARDELDDYDMPPELPEHDPARWPLFEIQMTKVDLQTMATAGSSWGLRPPLPPAPGIIFDV